MMREKEHLCYDLAAGNHDYDGVQVIEFMIMSDAFCPEYLIYRTNHFLKNTCEQVKKMTELKFRQLLEIA